MQEFTLRDHDCVLRRPARTQPTNVEALPTHVLVNGQGVEVHISPVGAVIERINIPDRSGRHTDVVLGFDKKTPYAVSTAARLVHIHTSACTLQW